MSTNLSLKARLARLAPVRDASQPRSCSGTLVPVFLRLVGLLDRPIDVVTRLRRAGLTLRAAHAAITRLADTGRAVCRIPEDAGMAELAADLAGMNVRTLQRRELDAALIAEVRGRHGLSQREFADTLGLDVDRVQNWEQGRNRPDAAVLSLVRLFDKDPALVQDVIFGPTLDDGQPAA